MFKNIFVNRDSAIRSGWKIAIVFSSAFLATFIVTSLFVFLYAFILLAVGKVSITNINTLGIQAANVNTPMGLSCALIQCICIILFVFLFWKVLDKKPIREIGLIHIKEGYKDLINGLLFGAISLTLVFTILYLTGSVKLVNPLNKPNFSISLLTGLILFIFVGINEEMFARGYCFTVLKQTGIKWIPIVVSSIIFALMHSLNSGISLLSYFNLFLFALLAVYMVIKSKNLWLSIGYHITWNYFEGNIFGFLVSGQGADGIYNVKNSVDNIINGGSFGPEGGLVVTLILILGFIYMWKFYQPKATYEIEF